MFASVSSNTDPIESDPTSCPLRRLVVLLRWLWMGRNQDLSQIIFVDDNGDERVEKVDVSLSMIGNQRI